jgi:RNA polymerase sigma-70 factor, ECF subfamily
LLGLTGSPVVALNRAVALARAHGAQAGLDALALASADPRIADYQPYWAARAALLAQAGDSSGSRIAYERALGLTVDPSVRTYLATQAHNA